MAQNEELEKVKKRIREMSNRTIDRGCTEAEFQIAANMIGKLLEQYNLNMSEIDLRDETCIQEFVQTTSKQVTPVDYCLVAIAKFCDCRVWHSRWRAGVRYYFFGMESDVQMAIYLTNIVEASIAHEAQQFKLTDTYKNAYPKKSATISFYRGMASRISARLNDMKAAIDIERAARAESHTKMIGSNVTSLVVVKKHIVEDAFKATNIRLRSNTSYNRVNHGGAYSKGHERGNAVNLSRPIGGNSSGPKLIGN